MLNPPPPLFDFAPPAGAKNAKPALVLCGAQQPVPDNETTTDWWTVATAIGNQVLDATTLAAIEAIKRDNAASIEALKSTRRDLAGLLSMIFQERRRQLGGAA